MYLKPKSAPARIVESRFVKTKTDAMKEIEAWVKKDDDPLISHEAVRVAGQLTDNITEDRMLRAKLWELSKERYKFLSKSDYEKKIFQDRMRRRSAALVRKFAVHSPSRGDRACTLDLNVDRPPPKQWRNARTTSLERLLLFADGNSKEKEKKMSFGADVAARTSVGVRSFTLGISERSAESSSTAAHVQGAVSRTEMEEGLPTPLAELDRLRSVGKEAAMSSLRVLPKQATPNIRHARFNKKSSVADSECHPAAMATITRRPTNSSSIIMAGRGQQKHEGSDIASASLSTNGVNVARRMSAASCCNSDPCSLADTAAWTAAAMQKAAFLWGRSEAPHGAVTRDPRYAKLESSLAPSGPQRDHRDLCAVISSIESLRAPPLMSRKLRPKTELKALQFMRERGFVF